MKKIRFGILSTARIGVVHVIPAMQQGTHTEVTAIASRKLDAARATADKLGIRHAYGSYEELLASPEIDAVYNPLPNHLHVEWSIKALAAGKHVLCEKPIALSSAEGQRLVDAAASHPKLKVMEAFMYRHHPQWQKAKAIVDQGGIGDLRTIQTWFSYYNDDAGNIRNQPEVGGGALMDIGCYGISLARFIFAAEPKQVFGQSEIDPRFGTDVLTSALLDFGNNRTSTFTCTTLTAPHQRVDIVGSTGRIEIEIPFNAPADKPCRLWHQTASGSEEISFPTCNHYGLQGDRFAQAVQENTPVPTPIADAVANMRVIEAIAASAKSGKLEPVVA